MDSFHVALSVAAFSGEFTSESFFRSRRDFFFRSRFDSMH